MPETLLPIPGLGHQDTGLVQSILADAGVFYRVHAGFGESPDVVLIWERDLAAVKELLKDLRVRDVADKLNPVPW